MQWSAGVNAGFTSGDPWLPIGEEYRVMNVERERSDPVSMLSLHRRLLALRRSEPALSIGSYRALPAPAGALCYARETAGQRFLVALNLTSSPTSVALGEYSGKLVLSTHLDRDPSRVEGKIKLRADEGMIIEV
jgi:alpha-glucosidase